MSLFERLSDDLKVPFGLDKYGLALSLETLAADIRSGFTLPQSISETTVNTMGDFEMITISVTYAKPH